LGGENHKKDTFGWEMERSSCHHADQSESSDESMIDNPSGSDPSDEK